jgi:chitin deacetylase
VLRTTHPGDIVIMHDGGGPRGETVAALPLILRGLERRHLRVVTVNRLLGERELLYPR